MADHLLGRFGGPVPVSGQLLDARATDRDDREFGGHEEAVGQNEEDDGQQADG